ncbi:hypothetical protein AVEN_55969-1 [Araneus ventricosus]|uniref:Uncharacterized protein n=1 Tax=Araneus ventricosus TaxID=182803 RepID=A0A4Y2GSG3_ARAVE|nr:hypothetical protein AVEN_55969-1 [Araneus ventricosus]
MRTIPIGTVPIRNRLTVYGTHELLISFSCVYTCEPSGFRIAVKKFVPCPFNRFDSCDGNRQGGGAFCQEVRKKFFHDETTANYGKGAKLIKLLIISCQSPIERVFTSSLEYALFCRFYLTSWKKVRRKRRTSLEHVSMWTTNPLVFPKTPTFRRKRCSNHSRRIKNTVHSCELDARERFENAPMGHHEYADEKLPESVCLFSLSLGYRNGGVAYQTGLSPMSAGYFTIC